MTSAISFLYHEVTDNAADSGFVRPSALPYKHQIVEFEKNIECIRKYSPKPILVSELDMETKKNQLMMTFDDGGKSALRICDIIEKNGWKGHFFITTNMIETETFLNASEIREVHDRGHIIGSHSHSHTTPFSSLSYSQACSEWDTSIKILEDIIGSKVFTASVPGGDMNEETLRSALESGITHLFTSEPHLKLKYYKDLIILGRVCPKVGTEIKVVKKFAQGQGYGKAQLLRFCKNVARKILGKAYISKIRKISAKNEK